MSEPEVSILLHRINNTDLSDVILKKNVRNKTILSYSINNITVWGMYLFYEMCLISELNNAFDDGGEEKQKNWKGRRCCVLEYVVGRLLHITSGI